LLLIDGLFASEPFAVFPSGKDVRGRFIAAGRLAANGIVPLSAGRRQALFRRSDGLVSTRRPFQFHKRTQLFIRTHNVALSVAAVRVSNPDRLPFGING